MDSILRLTALASIISAILSCYLLRHRNTLAKLFLLYFTICFTFILIKWNLLNELGTYDAKLYQLLGATISSQLHRDFIGNLPEIFHGYSAYTVPLGFLYFILGPSELVGQLFSTVIGLGVLYNVHRLTLACFNRQAAALAALMLTLYPYGWVLASTLNRDMPIAFFIALLFRTLAEAQNDSRHNSRKGRYAIVLVCIACLALLRPPLLLLCGLVLGLSLLVQRRGLSASLFQPLKTILAVALIVGAIITVFRAPGRLDSFPLARQALQFVSLENLNHRLESSEDANSAYMAGLRYASARDIPFIMPLATLYFMYSPLPWQVRSPRQALGLLDSALLLFLTYFFLKGITNLYHRRKKFTLQLLIFLIVGFCTSSLLQSNVGAAMRHRTMFFILMVPVAAHGLRCAPRGRTIPRPISQTCLPVCTLKKEGAPDDE